MKYGARFACNVCLAISMVFCLAVLFSSMALFVAPAHAVQETMSGSVSSSPSSGPVGAIISIHGAGWPDPNGEQISFGYMIASNCLPVPDSQKSTFQSGSFSGWLRLPNGTPLGTYSICATFGSTTAIANDYTVLSESSPQISISPSILTMKQQATITGSNYFPAGTNVQLFWEATNGSIILTLKPVLSNSNGLISSIFIIPTSTTVSSGSYKIVARVGGVQQSASFSYNTPTLLPTPTSTLSPTPTPAQSPTPQPTSDPTPTQHPSPTAVSTVVATPTTPTIAATAPVSPQQTHTGTPGAATTNQPTRIVLIGSAIGFLVLLAITLIMLRIRHKKAHSMNLIDSPGPIQTSPMNWQNNQAGSSFVSSMPYPITNGSMAPTQRPAPSIPTSLQRLQISPYTHLLQQADGASTTPSNDPATMTSYDPDIESIKRQVQIGLFATSGARRDD